MSDPIGPISEHPVDDLAAHALAALDDRERQEIDDHLAHCPACRAELARHHETLAVLTADEEAPPAAVWQHIAAGIGASGLEDPHGAGPATPTPPGAGRVGTAGSRRLAPVRPADDPESGDEPSEAGTGSGSGSGSGTDADDRAAGGPVTSQTRSARPRPWGAARLRWLAAAACLVIATATGGVIGFALGRSGDDADIGTLAQQASQDPGGVLGTLAEPGGQPVARVVADEDGAFMVLEGLPDLPEGRAYQLWSLQGPQPVSLGMLGRDGTNTVAFRLPPTITELAISVEPTSGEVTPTTGFQAIGRLTQRT